MTEDQNRFSPSYQSTLKLIMIEQILLGLLAGLILDGGGVAQIFLYTLVAFWSGFAMIVLRRPTSPTKTDLFLIKWGTFILFVISFGMASVIWQWRGVI